MTTIKPPTDPAAPPVSTETGATEETAGGAEFQALLDAPAAGGVAGAADAGGVSELSHVGGDLGPLVEQVRSGSLSVDGAVGQLVQRAIDNLGAALDPTGRAELESLLRSALESDPTLIALRNAAGES